MPKITRTRRSAPSKPARPSVVDRIAPIGFDEADGIKVMLYGRSGTGKTTLWSTFPKPILSIICSGSERPGELRSVDTPANREHIRQVVLHESDEMEELTDYLKNEEYATVVLDHCSGLQDLVLKEILGLDELPVQKNWGLASREDYGQCTMICKKHLKALLSLRGNVVIIAQEREFDNENSSEFILPSVGAGVTPALAGWLNSVVEYICRTFIRQQEVTKTMKIKKAGKVVVKETKVKTNRVEFCLHTAPHSLFTTKFRVPRGTFLPDVIVDPDYEKIKALIAGADPAG